MKRKKMLLFITIIVIAFLSFGCNFPAINDEEQEAFTNYEEFREVFGQDVFGYQLGFINPSHEPMGEILILESIEDELILSFSNFSGTNSEFLLKVFWNYHEVDFQVDHGEINNQYIFQSDYGESIELSIILSDEILFNDNNTAYLTAIIIREPQLHQKDINFLDHKHYGIASPHYVFLSEDTHHWMTVFEPSIFNTFNDYIEEDYYDFNVTTLKDEEIYLIPSTYIKVSGGEEVELNFLLGDITGEANQHFIIIALLNGNQIKIDNELLLPIKLPLNPETNNPIPQYGSFSLIAPYESGEYEFIAYAIGIMEGISGFSNIENSFRITVIVD